MTCSFSGDFSVAMARRRKTYPRRSARLARLRARGGKNKPQSDVGRNSIIRWWDLPVLQQPKLFSVRLNSLELILSFRCALHQDDSRSLSES
jgi:hypothetical protein